MKTEKERVMKLKKGGTERMAKCVNQEIPSGLHNRARSPRTSEVYRDAAVKQATLEDLEIARDEVKRHLLEAGRDRGCWKIFGAGRGSTQHHG